MTHTSLYEPPRTPSFSGKCLQPMEALKAVETEALVCSAPSELNTQLAAEI